ncbi:NAD-dependent epimerase/dehydratase family protein [Streptomyces sp. NBC_01217]|uniref:NAD-dependent epimerase/dehydratase family protein n=1 Tax=Streptomyces sp. NBC_01217 TaxID=2903779 RepID=UPI002E0FE82C|nr:NAD-dependent epimerase/dehydratase family protein [Streptomyces sp. NBC_01217]
MDIVGTGFLARSLRPLAGRHPGIVALAAGESRTSGASDVDYAREAALLRDVAKQCAADGQRLLFFSTAATGLYGLAEGPGREDTPVTPASPYGAHKLALEEQLRDSGVDYLILRLAHLVGPHGRHHQLIPTLVRQVRAGEVALHRGAARDLIGVRDMLTITDRLLAAGVRADTVNVASGFAAPVEDIVDHLAHALRLVPRKKYVDTGVGYAISTEKLHALVPHVADLGFDSDYYRRVLNDFIAAGGHA